MKGSGKILAIAVMAFAIVALLLFFDFSIEQFGAKNTNTTNSGSQNTRLTGNTNSANTNAAENTNTSDDLVE